jgi:hypothetical protein
MALTETQKVAIISALGSNVHFNREYSQINRNWLIRHMIEYYSAHGVADGVVRSTVQTFLTTCKTIVDSKQNFTIGVPFGAAIVRAKKARRVEILYGALAANPDLSVSANANLLDFIVKRRYRSVMRMDYFVNPNGQGYFRYPGTCSTSGGNYQVNIDATAYWKRYAMQYFKTLTPPAPLLPIINIEKLFIRKSLPCEGNLLDCARVLTVVFMDSLFESHDKNVLLPYLVAKPDFTYPVPGSSPVVTVNFAYLGICHPHEEPIVQFITDKSAEGLFSKSTIPPADLQVGDHVYIYNHPLYKVFNPNGSWRGEHALVYDLNDRNYRSRNGFLFGGHGKEGTLYQFYSAFMQELKTHIERTYAIAKVHLEFRQTGVISDGTHTIPGGTVIISTTITGTKIFEYHKTISYTDYENRGRTRTQSQFVIAHMNGQPYLFRIDKETTTAALIAKGQLTDPIPLKRRTDPAPGSSSTDDYNPEFYSIVYRKPSSTTDELYDLFQRVSSRIRLKQIDITELFADPFMVTPGTSNLITTQPRSDASAAYQTFLRAHSAIA